MSHIRRECIIFRKTRYIPSQRDRTDKVISRAQSHDSDFLIRVAQSKAETTIHYISHHIILVKETDSEVVARIYIIIIKRYEALYIANSSQILSEYYS